MNATESEEWRTKYFGSLNSLESEQRRFRTMEAVLKRLAGRLCIASLGQSSRLDAEIKKVQSILRRESIGNELERITAALTDAINALDDPAVAPPLAPQQPSSLDSAPVEAKDDERVRAVLATLLIELKRDPELAAQVDALDAKLMGAMTRDVLAEVLSALAEIVAQRIQRIERAKEEVEFLLNHMAGKLDEIGQYVTDQSQSQSDSKASTETLNTQLIGEMQAMGETVELAVDLQQIRTQVRSRIDAIGRHLQEFRQREAALAETMRARTEQMQLRVTELEAEAKKLQDQLKSEQRLSTIDLLTRIPNRLAYEKRVGEELKRWARFHQPTCIAVWDVDHFKQINDTYGHRAGDGVLRAVAKRLASRIRSMDFLARYGGEEFVMILCGTKRDDALSVINEIRIGISNLKFNHRGTPLSITISGGVTELRPGDSATVAFDRADKALYEAKRAGRNRCVSV